MNAEPQPLGSDADETAGLGLYFSEAEREQADLLAEQVGPRLLLQFHKRLNRLRRQFQDRPEKAMHVKQWLLGLPRERLGRYAELNAFETALLQMPLAPSRWDWHSAWEVVRRYPGVVAQSERHLADELGSLVWKARRRKAQGALPLCAQAAGEESQSTGVSRVRRPRAAYRPAMTVPTASKQ
ncbi:hypothetical protein ACIP5U_39075 [Streptomyces sp. NPDC088788]|uniref:hypothetical protein n=1 Tax=Streptomyces sp. NPDC088788 TaxID=3365898 RepID=UPI0038174524